MYLGQRYLITIEDLFNWSVKDGWSMFWDQGKRHYHEEMVFYELLTQLDNQQDGTVPANTVGAANEVPTASRSSTHIDLTE